MQFLKYNLIISCFLSCFHARATNKAMVIVPVADVIGAPIKEFGLAPTVKESYEKIGICGAPNQSAIGSPRVHQLLCNEIVDIITDQKTVDRSDEVCIRFDGAFFITAQDHHNQNHLYWTQKKNLLTLKKMGRRKQSVENIPPALSFKNPNATLIDKPVIVLTKPFFDPITQQTFSAGTRFVYNPEISSDTQYKIAVFDRLSTLFKITSVPVSHARKVITQSKIEAIACFVQLLKEWAQQSPHKIPYVWGGCSFTTTDSPFDYQLMEKKINKHKKYMIYERTHYTQCPLTGFDCAGLILRAAQICSIPYFYKNTHTLAHFLDPLTEKDILQEGDIIWIPGHVMIISDIKKNLLIEARGYSHDYGIVHEIELSKVFKGIYSYRQLINAHKYHSTLKRLNRAGEAVETISKFKILKIESAWK